GAWQLDAALRFAMALGDMDYYLEQPCMAMADNARLAANLRQPLILDESIACLGDLLEAHHLGIMSGVTLKISRIGGITKTKRLRDVAVELGLRVTIEDTGGSDIDSAATAHLMLSTPEGSRFHTVDFMNWVTVSNARGMPPCEAGQMAAPTRPGLGLQARREILGEPFFEIG
ncbi:MAG: mandelate racemase/muconate lactonizing enzyme family protein, partial [Pseudomonadota bacterium]